MHNGDHSEHQGRSISRGTDYHLFRYFKNADSWPYDYNLNHFSVSGYPYEINITDIKDTSAICSWKTTELAVEEFLVCKNCTKINASIINIFF